MTSRLLSRWNGALWSLVELFALCGFAFTQPVLDVMGRSPDFFLFRQAGRREIVLLTAVVVVVPAVVLWGVETLVGLVTGRARRVVHVAFRAGLLAIIGLQTLKSLSPLRGPALVAVSAAVAVVAVVLLLRHPPVRLWLRYLTPAPLVFAALFLVFSPVSDLVLPSSRGAVAAARTDVDTPVVVLFFDEFPLMSLLNGQGQIDERLYPNFARLARESTWFRNATGVSAFTPEAVPAMLSGRYPRDKAKAPTAAQYPNTLFSLLSKSHDLVSFETITSLCPRPRCETPSGTGAGGTRVLLKDASRVWRKVMSPRTDRSDITQSLQEETTAERRQRYGAKGAVRRPESGADVKFGWGWLDENQPARFRDFLASLDGDGGPTVWFLHLLLPHRPWRYLPSGVQYDPWRFTVQERDGRKIEGWPGLHSQQRHLLQTVYTDGLLGQVLDRLEETGLYKRSLLVVAADHGMSFVEGDTDPRRLNRRNAHQVASVPFFVKAPSQRTGQHGDANVQVVDLVPTVADILDLDVPWKTDGISAVGRARRPTGSKQFFQDATVRILETDELLPKVLQGMSESLARPELGVEGLYAIGPYAELVGTRSGNYLVAGTASPRAAIDGGVGQYEAADPKRWGAVPAIVAGEVTDSGGLAEPYSVAVAVNGTIGAVSEVFPWKGTEHKFAAMVSDSRFGSGGNTLELFLVTRDRGAITLHPVRL